MASFSYRVMTYNIGGGRCLLGTSLASVLEVIREARPDILAVQEATDYQDADGRRFSAVDQIAKVGAFARNHYFGPTLSVSRDMDVRRAIMVDALFHDWKDWRHGNALFSRWDFVRLSDPSRVGSPQNVPIYRPPVYKGTRNTDPRYALVARVNSDPLFPFICGVHLTTLVGERGSQAIPSVAERAQILRFQQARRLLDLMRMHVLAQRHLVFLLGDFNAGREEPCIANVLEQEGGFVCLQPANAEVETHMEVGLTVDHILVYPRERLLDYRCWVIDSPTARSASDHLPVLAEITVE